MRFRSILPLCLLAGLLVGCSTITSRIQEKSAVFATLDAATQAKIRKGTVELGYTPDMVYMALGSPDEAREKVSGRGGRVTWTYTSTYQEYLGTTEVGYRRVFVQNPKTGAVYVYLDPVYSDIYRDQIQENIRIIFHDGRVAVIERAKP